MPPRRRGSKDDRHPAGGGALSVPLSPVENAIRWLGGRRRFEREVQGFLRAAGVSSAEAEAAVERLRELGLVSDEETSRAFVRDRLRFAPKGRALLLAELRRKGAKSPIAEDVLQELFPATAEADVAEDFLRRFERKWRDLPPGLARRRMWSALARRGFPRDAAREALARVAGEWAEADESMSEENCPEEP